MPLPQIVIAEEEKQIPFHAYNILSTLLEKEFDELCALASAICQTPVALIKLLEEEKPFIKTADSTLIALSPNDYVKYAETVAFAEDIVVIDSEPVFYAGIPLINAEGATMGSLCVVDTEKRSLSDLQSAALKILASQVMDKLELKKQDIALKKAYQALTNAHNFTQKFAAMAAHDIKNPLSSISLTAQALKVRLKTVPDEGCMRLVDMNISGIKKMSLLLDDMLAYSKDPSLLHKKKQVINLPELLFSVTGMLDMPDNMDFRLPEEGVRLQSSYIALEQIFINLFTNAIRYNDKAQGIIQVRFSADANFDYFEIEDNGIGIAAAYHERIFSDNFTLRITDRYNKKGNGIGLSTVRELVNALDGTIRLTSELGQGTVFFISLKK